ncbi:TPA: DUF1302 family protein [Pseudomonas aeruginosa]|nr:DUF1302 family protein [Pseudomonas aeruginosa]HBO9448533.1 DUF1302 family protein [Pseudomonas aeruginosa]HBO9460098.1 DUF1302 family protein [Pseudomonas aeruginosa]HBO9483383.1 DUF1302 family protein [Pseudomonas aeruginosa]HBO9507186.1 DUF1302 family protein [Pseudomonas aeruginosa]
MTTRNPFSRRARLPLAVSLASSLAAPAFGVTFNIGEIEGSFDSALSVGASWSTAKPNKNLIGVNNGGKGLSQTSDDSHLNFKRGETFSKVFKGIHDLELKYGDTGVFLRGKYWYDFELKDEHREFKDIDDSGRKTLAKSSGAELLDAFIYHNYAIGDLPGSVRLGKQVVNWGESTFIQNGISAINPIDVTAFRRPGSEIKEGLIPVNMFYLSQNLTDNLSAEGFYQIEWDQTVVDNCGTFFSQPDVVADGCDITRYRGGSVRRLVTQATPQVNGSYQLVYFQDAFTFRTNLKDYNPNKPSNVLFYFKQRVTAPSRLAGNVLLVHETLNQVKEPRLAWLYNAGQRRVRRAPQVSYDGPGTAADGLRTSDNFDMYNGAPDRYDWKLEGKKEIYIPYNSYKLDDPKIKYSEIVKAGHINQDLTRYELHRVWHVVATLKPGERHIYAKRDFYIDEDTWQAAEIDHYDGRGTLWRVAEAHAEQYYDKQVPWYAVETLYDLLSGRYLALGMKNEEKQAYDFNYSASESDYTPAALRQEGVR